MADRQLGSMVMEDAGEGPAVVMIHGLGGSSNSFECLMDTLDGYRVLRPDLPGAARSSFRPGSNALGGLVTAVREQLSAVGIESAHFVGHSMGTLICQYLAVDHPSLVKSLTLFGPMKEPPVAAKQALRERASIARRDGMAGIAEQISMGSVAGASRTSNPVAKAFVRESLMRQQPNGYASHCEALSESTAAKHAKILCSTLLVAGEHDPVTPLAMARAMDEDIQNTMLEVIPEISHWMMIEAPERSAALLREHLDRVEG